MNQHQPPTNQDLDDIEARAAALYEYATVTDPEGQAALEELTDKDVPVLVDEVRRLRAELASYEMLAPQQCPAGKHADWLVDSEYAHACPWCEIEKLRDELATALRPDTPRLCACGHSNLAHTVPAPHSCFAHGQTCPCPAYRQLPHDEAVAQLKRNQKAAAERAAAVLAAGVTGE